jgi:transcription initiation factor IIE alpha subunit
MLQHHPHNSTPTSKAAAHQIQPVAGSQGHKIMSFLRTRGRDGATAEEIETATGISGNSVRPRLIQLRKADSIADSGKVRATRANRMAVVWVVAE